MAIKELILHFNFSIGKLIMQDIRRVFADYLEYVNCITDAMNNMYKHINSLPLIAYTKHAMNTVYEKVRIQFFYYIYISERERVNLLLKDGHVSTRSPLQ